MTRNSWALEKHVIKALACHHSIRKLIYKWCDTTTFAVIDGVEQKFLGTINHVNSCLGQIVYETIELKCYFGFPFDLTDKRRLKSINSVVPVIFSGLLEFNFLFWFESGKRLTFWSNVMNFNGERWTFTGLSKYFRLFRKIESECSTWTKGEGLVAAQRWACSSSFPTFSMHSDDMQKLEMEAEIYALNH